jgi:hypothetical protein
MNGNSESCKVSLIVLVITCVMNLPDVYTSVPGVVLRYEAELTSRVLTKLRVRGCRLMYEY